MRSSIVPLFLLVGFIIVMIKGHGDHGGGGHDHGGGGHDHGGHDHGGHDHGHHDHDHGGWGGHDHHHHGGWGHHWGGGGGGGGDHGDHGGSSPWYYNGGYGGGYYGYGYRRPRIGLLGLLFGRRNYYQQPYYYPQYQQQYQCRVAQFVDYVGRMPRYYCDCPPYPPNYQYNTCVPMNVGK